MGRRGIVLAGGLGTRLRQTVPEVPKVIAPVDGRPFLARLLDQLVVAGFSDVVIATGYQAGVVEEVIGNQHGPIHVTYSRETEPLGTGGAVGLAKTRLPEGDGSVFVMNGDSTCAVSFDAFEAFHHGHGGASLVLVPVPDAARFGRVQVNQDGWVQGFFEKGEAGPGWINAGIYCFSEDVLAELDARPSSIEKEVFPAMIGKDLAGYQGGGRFIDIGVPDSYAAAQSFFAPDDGDRGLVLLDRDGNLIVEKHYLHEPDAVELLPGAIDAVRFLQQRGFGVVVATNQSGVGRGLYDMDAVDAVHDRIRSLFADQGVGLPHFLVCPHHPDENCGCRKPKAGMVTQARQWGTPVAFVGDKSCDVDAAQPGMKGVLVRTGYGREHERLVNPDHVAEDVWAAAAWLDQELP